MMQPDGGGIAATGGSLASGGSTGSSGNGGSSPAAAPGGASAGAAAGAAGAGGGAALGGAGGTGLGSGTPVLDGPFYTRLQRLTKEQWERAVADLLRLDPSSTVLDGLFPPSRGKADFNNNERLLLVDLAADLAFETGAEDAAARATGSPEAMTKVYAGTDAAGFVRTFGRRAFRRPLTTDEENRYQAIFAVGEQLYGAGFNNGAALVIRAMLQSPKFLYRSELGEGGQPLDGYEVASKLSFLLDGTTPSDALLDLAAAGGLDSADGIEQAARPMLEDDRAAAVALDFHGQLYHLDQYGSPASSPKLPSAWLELAQVTQQFFDSVFRGGEGLRAILTSKRYFVGPAIADLYELDRPPNQIEQRTLDTSRVGFFMQVPFLWVNGTGFDPDSIGRGAALNDQVLCVTLEEHGTPPPPVPYASMSGQTNRSRVEQITASCGGCHTNTINPLGFAFEGFDTVGSARTQDNGSPIDTKGSYTLGSVVRSFTGAKDLMSLLADSAEANGCYARKLMGYALQRDIVDGDRSLLTDLATVSRTQSLKEMIVSLVRNPAFRLRAEAMP
jgi:uncharacterized protein DUF1592/uncharacterized protein DUF1595/uncharacterized protein DUF1588/uncharacterized protein DUF1585/uncharacterized protein DUF1587